MTPLPPEFHIDCCIISDRFLYLLFNEINCYFIGIWQEFSILGGVLILCCAINLWVIVFTLPILGAIAWLRSLSIASMRELKRLESISKLINHKNKIGHMAQYTSQSCYFGLAV